MHLAKPLCRDLAAFVTVAALSCALAATATADRIPLVGSAPSAYSQPSATTATGLVTIVDPTTLSCVHTATFDDVSGAGVTGMNYDGPFASMGVNFAERFVGQAVSYAGNFDVISGVPGSPLLLQAGLPGQNLDVFSYLTNVLAGLGNLGYPDFDAIGEGSIAMSFTIGQAQIGLDVVGGNGGSATLEFYRGDGSLIDTVVLSGLADHSYGFLKSDGVPDIKGILIQSTDPSGFGIDNVCHDVISDKTQSNTWGTLKTLYR
jgi:hypothetical protein